MRDPDLLAAIGPVAGAFEKLGVLYYIGGSIASSAYGAPRATLDVDMVSDLKPQHVRFLAESVAYPVEYLQALTAFLDRKICHPNLLYRVDFRRVLT